MIHTTAEASNTRLGDFREATSTLPVLANQCFRRWLKCGFTRSLAKATSSGRACRRRSRGSPPQASCKSIRACWLKLRPSQVGSQTEQCHG